MFVYSGKCKLCETGIRTGFRDMAGKELFTGDIVIIFTNDYAPGDLTVIVAEDFENVIGVAPRKLAVPGSFFVMGIRNAVPVNTESETVFESGTTDLVWHVRKVKSFTDVVDGEHWQAYGFRYSND